MIRKFSKSVLFVAVLVLMMAVNIGGKDSFCQKFQLKEISNVK